MTLQNDFDNVFNGKTVFVTGHTGFIGGWLISWLNSLGAKIIGYSLEPPTNPSLFETLGLEKKITHITGNVNDFSFLYKCMSEHQPDMVFHLAAQSLVRLSYNKPIETFQTNIMGTANVLESVRTIPSAKTCIIMTSDKCYENRGTSFGYKENDPMGGHDPYSASKGAAELVVSSYKRSFFDKNYGNKSSVGISTIRAGNVIGGGDWAEDRIVPDCIRSLINRKSIPIRNPDSVRPWQFVLEPLFGILLLASKMSTNPSGYSQAWNFGPLISNKKTIVRELVSQIISEWGEGEWKNIDDSNVLHESNLLVLDSTKATDSLGWFPVYSINEAIHETISWYRAYFEGKMDMKELTLNQIQDYSKKVSLLKNSTK